MTAVHSVAPEIWEGCYDERCDVWALGVCAYIMLYRAMPFNGADVEEVQRKVLQDDPSYVPLLQASVSPLAERFVRSLLEKDPGMRIQLPIALEHPFIATPSSCTASVSRRTADSAANLVGYLHMTDTKKLLLKAVAFCLNTAQITQLSAGFDEMDKDKNGVICMTELRHALTHSEGVGKAQLEQVLEDVDLDPGAVLNYSEFLAAAMHRHLQVEEERLRLAFAKIDKDGTGHLTPESMRQFLGQDVGENRSVLEVLTSVSLRDAQPSIDGKVASMFSEMDYNNDGKIDYCEFLKYWRSISVVRHVNVKQRFASAVKRVVSGLKFITALKANQR
jgi:calcium-dependent protein kinase